MEKSKINKNNNFKKYMAYGLLGLGITGLSFHLLRYKELHGSALFYIAIPLLLAYVFINTLPSKTYTGRIIKGISIVLLMSGPILQEGFICIIMAAPLFYIIGGIVGAVLDYRKRKHSRKIHSSILITLMLIMSLEGTHPLFSFERANTVVVKKRVNASVDEVKHQINIPINLGRDVPTYLKLFPFPTSKSFTGNQVGDINTLNFIYKKHFYFNAVIGDLQYQIIKTGNNFIESRVISDQSYVNTYLNWRTSKVSWKKIDNSHTEVVWEISYERKLDPAWYFGTLEKYTVTLMANTLIKYSATPRFAR